MSVFVPGSVKVHRTPASSCIRSRWTYKSSWVCYTNAQLIHGRLEGFPEACIWYQYFLSYLLPRFKDQKHVRDVCFGSSTLYRSKLDRWPCHVTLSEKRLKNTLSRVFSTYILGQKVDLIRNVTLTRSRFLLFLNSFFDHIAVFEQFLVSIWAIKLTLKGMWQRDVARFGP